MRTSAGSTVCLAALAALAALATLAALAGCGRAGPGHGSSQVRFSALVAAARATTTAPDRDRATTAVCDKVATKVAVENAVLQRADLWTGWSPPSPAEVYCPYSTVGTTATADLAISVRLVTGGPTRLDRMTPTARVAIRDGVQVTATSPTGLVKLSSARLQHLLDETAGSIRAR